MTSSSSPEELKKFDLNEHPHIRFNPLRDEWVLCSPHRTKRPWKGQVEKLIVKDTPKFDPTNPLCPGVTRPSGIKNPDYESTHVFENDFPALYEYTLADEDKLENTSLESESPPSDDKSSSNDVQSDLFKTRPAKGNCQVMCFHPRSDLTVPTMEHVDLVKVVEKWIDLYNELKHKYEWVQIFENKGEMMGCSNMHPHCQIWASNYLPNNIRVEHRAQLEFTMKHGGKRVMLVEYLKAELAGNRERIVFENDSWVALVPYWATWPYETMLLPKRHVTRLDGLTRSEREDLANAMKRLTIKYDNMFQCSFPYSMGFHFAPSGSHLKNEDEESFAWQFFASYLPPLLRSSTIKKFMVGYELLAQAQRDLSPEQAAAKLRDLSDTQHYSDCKN